jgi:protein involved in ribonucleotide reduction
VEKNKQQQATILFQSILQKQLFVHNEQTQLFKAKLGVELVKQLELQGTRGDVALLAKTISSSNDCKKDYTCCA